MDATTILRNQLQQAHEMVEQAVADLTPEQLQHRAAGATVQPIAAIYAHLVTGEDGLVNGMLRGQQPIFARDGWAEKVGGDFGSEGMLSDDYARLTESVRLDALREYAQQVYAETDRYIASLGAEDLDRTITVEWMGGDTSVGDFLGTIVVWHAVHHGGEICALKGCMGGKGLPF